MPCNTARTCVFTVLSLLGLSACDDTQNQADWRQGKEIVQQHCKVCHAQGINGAPIIGNQKMWGPRINKGREALVANAIQGVGLMPAMGGRGELTDEEIELAVGYLLAQLEQH